MKSGSWTSGDSEGSTEICEIGKMVLLGEASSQGKSLMCFLGLGLEKHLAKDFSRVRS